MANSESKPKAKLDSRKPVPREYVYGLRGKLKGKGLLKALRAEKAAERSGAKRVMS